jgi:phosphate starvation-inducible PhoH-like protein
MNERKPRKQKAKEGRLEKARSRARRQAKPAWEPTDFQRAAREAFRDNDILVLSGAPGTSKTATATWLAVNEFLSGRVQRLHLVRPAVEAGERLGFLPGDLAQKLDPFARPVYEFLRALGLDPDGLRKSGTLELVPVGMCKGRTFSGSCVILDEAQDCTRRQLRLVLSRLGANSRMIVTGDPAMSDADEPGPNAFQTFCAKLALNPVDGVRLFTLGETDILRHSLVPDLLRYVDE